MQNVASQANADVLFCFSGSSAHKKRKQINRLTVIEVLKIIVK